METETTTTVPSDLDGPGRLRCRAGRASSCAAAGATAALVGSGGSAAEMLAYLGRSEVELRRFLHGLPGVDQVGAEARAASLATRSIKTTAKLWALEMAVRMIDLTTLEGADTAGKVLSLCAKARRPDPADAVRAPGRRRLHLPRPRSRRQAGAGGQQRGGGLGGDGLPLGARLAGSQARGRARRRRRRCRRGRHGHRPGSIPCRPLRPGPRGGPGREAGVRPRPSEGHPGDGGAGYLRQRAQGELPRHGGRS